jgi:hypothetical protein
MNQDKIVIFFGAGATKACEGPLTDDFLPLAFGFKTKNNEVISDKSKTNMINLSTEIFPSIEYKNKTVKDFKVVEYFLCKYFALADNWYDRDYYDYPDIFLVLSIVDKAISQNEQLGRFTTEKLRKIRKKLNLLFGTLQKGTSRLNLRRIPIIEF